MVHGCLSGCFPAPIIVLATGELKLNTLGETAELAADGDNGGEFSSQLGNILPLLGSATLIWNEFMKRSFKSFNIKDS